MSPAHSVAALLLLVPFVGSARGAFPPAEPVPDAVLTHPATRSEPPPDASPHRWVPNALATWPGPWGYPLGLYDHRYVTW